MATTETVEIETGQGAVDGSIIWLHGLGADGHDFEPIVPELALPEALGLRFVFPHAPRRPVTINGGMTMRAWYDILSLERGAATDDEGVRASAAILRDLIEREEQRGIDASRVVVAGFSQGGAIALHTALRFPRLLGGVMALSTYLPLAETVQEEAPGVGEETGRHLSKLPIFMAHGSMDPVLPMVLGQDSARFLLAHGFDVEWHEYSMGHSVCAEEIADIRNWLVRVFDVE